MEGKSGLKKCGEVLKSSAVFSVGMLNTSPGQPVSTHMWVRSSAVIDVLGPRTCLASDLGPT